MSRAEGIGGLFQMKIGENISYFMGGYRGTTDDLKALPGLLESPDLRKKYPNHTVFVDGTEVVGALPLDPHLRYTEQYNVMNDQLKAKLKKRKITAMNCAMIRTGLEPDVSAPAPVLEPGLLFSVSAPTR